MRRRVEYFVVCAIVGTLAIGAMTILRAQSALPSPWTTAAIGGPSLAGAASFSNQQFTVSSGGVDIWNTTDQFRFVYQQVSGDVDIVARVDSLAAADLWSKAGVMIRADLSASSAHAYALISGGNGIAFQRRLQAGGTSSTTAGQAIAAPQWVRLKRVGNVVTAYSSGDGGTWQTVGSATIALNQSAFVGFAVTSHNPGGLATAVFSQSSVTTTVTTTALPSGQQTRDIGTPAIAGSATYSGGTYTISGAGADIWGTADQFRYVYQPLTGDVDVAVRVASLQGADKWAKAGVMVRESLNANARNAMALVSAGHGSTFQWRLDTGGLADFKSGPNRVAPTWVRLVRTGFRFEAFSSTNGTSWTSMGVETVPMTDPVFVGLAVTSHTVSSSATAAFDHLTISSSTPTNKPPTVSLTAPAAGATFTAPATINLAATASDPENQLARVEFYQGSTLIATDTASPYTATWSSAPAGTYALTAVAVDAAGNRTTSAPVSVTVNATTNKPPTVSLTAPAAGATFTAPATISLAATASDPENQLARVEFYRSGTLISSDTAAPYTATWSSAPAGTYSLTAVAVDAAGNRTTSAAVSITVNAAAAAAPRLVVFHASADHATLVTSYRFDVFANGANPSTATPIASSDLGKPTPDANGDITVDRSSFFTALAPGTYVATVSAVGAGGIGRSAPATFTR